MRTIAIVLNDNDFGRTMIPLLESVCEIIKNHRVHANHYDPPKEDVSEEFIKSIIDEGIRYFYISFQAGEERFRDAYKNDEISKVITYLLENMKVLFNDEAEDYVMNNDCDGGAWYLDLQSDIIRSF